MTHMIISNSSLGLKMGRRWRRTVMVFARKLWQRLVAARVAEVTAGTAGTPGPRWRWRRHPEDQGGPGQDLLLLPPDVVRGNGVSRGHRIPAVLHLILFLPDVGSVALGSVHDLLSFSQPPLHHREHVVVSSLLYSHRDCRQTPLILSAEDSSPLGGRQTTVRGPGRGERRSG